MASKTKSALLKAANADREFKRKTGDWPKVKGKPMYRYKVRNSGRQ